MVRLNVSLIVEKDENRGPLRDIIMELVACYLRDKVCFDYDFYKSKTNDDRWLIYETWESEEALKAHAETEHFKRLAPRLQELATKTTEKFVF